MRHDEILEKVAGILALIGFGVAEVLVLGYCDEQYERARGLVALYWACVMAISQVGLLVLLFRAIAYGSAKESQAKLFAENVALREMHKECCGVADRTG